jgi:predicted DNA-binding mobile mystery protein A
MKHRQLKRVREQLDETLRIFAKTASVDRPIRGWIRAIRNALGMNMRQLADRLGVSQSRISKIEQDELSGALTIKTLEKIADQLDCVFVYGFAPRTSLEKTVRKQAACVAQERLNKISHHMYLEAQELTNHHAKAAFENTVEEVLESPSKLWNKNYKMK